jgi:hypothetical protein
MDNEHGQHLNLLDKDLGASIAAMVEAEVSKSLDGLDIEAMVQTEIEKAMHKIEHKINKAKHRAQEHQRRAEEHKRRAKERAERAEERAKRAAERAARRAERKAHGVNITLGVESDQASAPQVSDEVSDEERLSVLHMLEGGTITPEQADMLLNALAG